jgi:S-adenosylmethionine decarboxylase
MNIDGMHVICDFYGCGVDLNDKESLTKALIDAAKKAKSTVCSVHAHDFEPQGYSIVVILAESHESVHTFPESGEISFDCFTCGNTADPVIACDYMIEFLKPQKYEKTVIKRGKNINITSTSQP